MRTLVTATAESYVLAEGPVWDAPRRRLLWVDIVGVPAPHTSSVAFADDDLRTLVVTTPQDGLSEEQLRDNPLPGYLFSARVEVPGTPVAPWSGWAGPATAAP